MEYGLIYENEWSNPKAKRQYVWRLQKFRKWYENENCIVTYKANDSSILYSIEDKGKGVTYYNFNCWTFNVMLIEELATGLDGLAAMEAYHQRWNAHLKRDLFLSPSFASAAKKRFLDEYMKPYIFFRKLSPDVDELLTSKSGISNHRGYLYVNEELRGKVLSNVKSYDLRSAYAATWLRKKFPTVSFREEPAYNFPYYLLEGNEPFLALYKEKGQLGELVSDIVVRRRYEENGEIKIPQKLWISCYGWVDDKFRYAVQKLYNEKEEFKKLGRKFEANERKGMLEILYGCQIADWSAYNSNSSRDKQNASFRFGCPAYGQWAHDYVEDEVIRTIWKLKKNGCTIVAADTDSVKYIGDFDLEDCGEIGDWKFEGLYSRFCQFAPKSYCFEDFNNAHIKSSAVGKEERLDLEKLRFEDIVDIMKKRHLYEFEENSVFFEEEEEKEKELISRLNQFGF